MRKFNTVCPEIHFCVQYTDIKCLNSTKLNYATISLKLKNFWVCIKQYTLLPLSLYQ
jgi:hypothetical protein